MAHAGYLLAALWPGTPAGSTAVLTYLVAYLPTTVAAFGLLQASDAFAPVCFNIGEVPLAWAPTLELTVHVRGVAAPGPLRCRFHNRFMQHGMFEEDGEIWDSHGELVAQSRQLALIPRG